MNSNLKLSIITITFNSEDYLEQTILSVINQSYKNIEYIIVDGDSTDNTLNIIKKYEPKVNTWISEPDNGIADAMNKGLKLATGDYILFLHSDDYLIDSNIIKKAIGQISIPCDIILFNIILERDGKKMLTCPRGLTWWINFKTGVFHQSTFCSRSLFQEIGHFDQQFRITMDYDFFLRAYRAGIRTQQIALPISLMRLVGISSQRDWPSLQKRFLEEQIVHHKNLMGKWMPLLYKVYWTLYLPYKKACCFFNRQNKNKPKNRPVR